MKKGNDIIWLLHELNPSDFEHYQEWYINHPYCKGIREIQELVNRGKPNRTIKNSIQNCTN